MKNIAALILILSSIAPFVHATDRVPNNGELFRVDLRPYSSMPGTGGVFEKGLSAWGDNDDLLAHVKGTSCANSENQTSAFVSLSADGQWAADYARRLFMNSNVHDVYIYIINSDTNIYNSATSLAALPIPPQGAIETAERQSEWLAFQGIPNNRIRGVRHITRDNIHNTPAIISNPHFVRDSQANINTRPYIQHSQTRESTSNITSLAADQIDALPVSAGLSATLYCQRSGRSKRSTEKCSYVEKYTRVLPSSALVLLSQ